ncbi:helix-turn-helix transcriptional regulator [Thermopolyspora sp. NPDC052614]|uniref:helix-turn-helix domain-containing protein n=1 Tax=Thermopolyspora sp. NPDC052614 TaxID=3155682 RepID=UPI00342754B5
MAAVKWTTLRAHWLGQQLRELREANNLLLKEAAEYLQRNPGTVGRFETGEYPIRRPDLMALLDLYGVSDGRRRDALLRLSQDVWQKGWWDGYSEHLVGTFVDYVWLESRAKEIRAFDNALLPGLLHTLEYARASITAAELDASEEQINHWLDLRMARQKILKRDEPPCLMTIIDEGILRREVGGRECLAAQLEYLSEQAMQPNIEVRVLPLSAGAHASPAGAFRIFTMEDPLPEIGYAETPTGAVYIESPDAGRLMRTYDRLRELTLTPGESVQLISTIVEELR